MIKSEVFINQNNKEIYFWNNDEVAIRHLVLDLQDNVIQDELTEFTNDGKCLTSVVFASDYQTILGYREYFYDKKGTEIGYSNYKRINGNLEFVYRAETSYSNNLGTICKFYDHKDNFVYYETFENDPEHGIYQVGTFTSDGEEVLGISFPRYSDY